MSNNRLSATFWSRLLSGLVGFREQFFTSGAEARSNLRFSDTQARRLRYAVYWAHYENNVYRKVHNWSDILKAEYQLYAYTRSIYSPAYRLGEFWANHLMGGTLDPAAGDGVERPSALPILTDNDAVRTPIAQIWKDSNWQGTKSTWTRFGAVMGDVGLRVVDDAARQKVYLRVVHPRDIDYVKLDPFGNVKEYAIEELRPDPREPDVEVLAFGGRMLPEVIYAEECMKDGPNVLFKTYLNGEPYDWRDYPDDSAARVGPEWTMPYGFVPFVFTRHRDMGMLSGWAEMHPGLSKIHELDDMASKLDDQIRKIVNSPWFFTGTRADALVISAPDGTDADPEPGREIIPTIYSENEAARAMPMVTPLDIAATSAHIKSILDAIQKDFPELLVDDPTADVSGESRRVARQQTIAKVSSRRPTYDDALVRGLQMGISIGALGGYPGFEGFSPADYEAGRMGFSIGERAVFAVDPMDRLQEDNAQATLIKTLTDAGLPLAVALHQAGWSDERVAEAMDARAREQEFNLEAIRKQQAAYGGAPNSIGSSVLGEDTVTGVVQ